ncbi:MAG: glycoside hydrolase domain-containing protein [Planctomycetota bacterium]
MNRNTPTLLLALLFAAKVALAGGVTVVPVTIDPPGTGKAGPARIFGARNGSFSAQLVAPVGSRATVTDLTGPGKIPASAIAVRYAHFDGPGRYPFFDGLHATPPAKPGKVQPIWVTVRVPKDAKAGEYKGKVRVGGAGVDLHVSVADWTIPDVKDFATHVGLIQSPDSVAMQYGVPMWSERHWQLMEKSFELLGGVSAKSLYIPVQRRTHFGNEHGMVVWKKNGKGLVPDLSIVEKYVAMAAKHLGKVPVVCLYAWELDAADASHFPAGKPKSARTKDRKILISVRESGKLTEGEAPAWGTPECRAFWKPVFSGVKSILAKHGMADSMMVGITGDYTPSDTAVKDIAAAAPAAKWVAHAHGRYDKIHGSVVGLQVSVWGIHGLRDPAAPCKWHWQRQRYYGWKRGLPLTSFPRYGSIYGNAVSPLARKRCSVLAMYRSLAEVAMTSQGQPKFNPGCNGFDRLGADFWPVLKGKRRSSTICGRYPEAAWGQLNINTATPSILAPGPNGAVTTMRLEMLREGLQEMEARKFIEKALLDPAKKAKLGGLAEEAQKMLDERIRAFMAAVKSKGSGWTPWAKGSWHERSAELYRTAAKVAARTGAK